MGRYAQYEGERYWDFGNWGGEIKLDDGSIFECSSGSPVIVTESGAIYDDGAYEGQVSPKDLEAFTGTFEEE